MFARILVLPLPGFCPLADWASSGSVPAASVRKVQLCHPEEVTHTWVPAKDGVAGFSAHTRAADFPKREVAPGTHAYFSGTKTLPKRLNTWTKVSTSFP